MRLSEEMPGCMDHVRKEYRVYRIVGVPNTLPCALGRI